MVQQVKDDPESPTPWIRLLQFDRAKYKESYNVDKSQQEQLFRTLVRVYEKATRFKLSDVCCL